MYWHDGVDEVLDNWGLFKQSVADEKLRILGDLLIDCVKNLDSVSRCLLMDIILFCD